jgi:protein-tyrosine phosphatase
MAAAFLARHADELGWDATVRSAGTQAVPAPMMDDAARALRRRGLTTTEHVARPLLAELVDASDLVLVMEQAHLLEVLSLSPTAAAHTFRWAELARLPLDRRRAPDEPIAEWAARLHAERGPSAVLDTDTSDDVPDPTGRGRRAHRRTAEQLDAQAGHIAVLISARPATASG